MWRAAIISLINLSLLVLWLGCGTKGPQDSCGFVQNSNNERISWQGKLPVKLMFHQNFPAQFIPAALSAADKWNAAMGKEMLRITPNPSMGGPDASVKDGVNVIYFKNDWWVNKPTEQARTEVNSIGDLITDADILVNGKFPFYFGSKSATSAVNIEAVLLHEMGHVLGLKHKDEGFSVMATFLPPDTDRVTVARTDIESLKCVY